jgi:phage-related protein
MYSLNNFREKINDIARPYHFLCTYKGGCFDRLGDAGLMTAGLRTTALPSLTVSTVPINYFGMIYNIAGAPTYDPLTCQFLIDADYTVREAWKNALEAVFKYNEGTGPVWARPTQYMGTVTLQQKNTERQTVATYVLSMAWISVLGTIGYDQGTRDNPLVFDATISYSYYTKK